MNDKDLEKISLRIAGKVDPTVIKNLKSIRDDSPFYFGSLASKLITIPGDGRIAETELIAAHSYAAQQEAIAIRKDTLNNERYAAGSNACKTFGAIATIIQAPKLQRNIEISQSVLAISKQLGTMHNWMATGAASLANLANPALAVATLTMQILSSFLGSKGPSYEEIVQTQLREISQQIRDMHLDMREQFIIVQKSLLVIYDGVVDCIKYLTDFRGDVSSRLNSVENKLENLRKIIEANHTDIFVQDLENICTQADALLENQIVADEHAVQKIAHELENLWIMQRSTKPSMNGRESFMSGNDNQAHIRDCPMLERIDENLKNRLGYLFRIAQEMGLDMRATQNEGQADIDKLLHLDIFEIAIAKYLSLRMKFPYYVKDDPQGGKFIGIANFADNTLNFVKKIQNSEVIFANLFNNYKNALANVAREINAYIEPANAEYRALMAHSGVSIHDDLSSLRAKFAINARRMPKDAIAKGDPSRVPGGSNCGVNIPHRDLNHFTTAYPSFDFPAEMLIVDALNIASLKATYKFFHVRQSVGSPTVWSIGSDYYEWAGRTISEIKDYTPKPGYSGYHRIEINFSLSDGSYKHRCGVDSYFNDDSYGNIPDDDTLANRILKTSVGGHCYDQAILDTLAAMPAVSLPNPGRDAAVANLQQLINSKIREFGKEKVAGKIVHEASVTINNAFQHLESSHRRLLAFALLAGIPESVLMQINALPTKAAIKSLFSQYINNNEQISFVGTVLPSSRIMDNAFWTTLPATMIDNLSLSCQALIRQNRETNLFASPIGRRIEHYLNLISWCQQIYVNYLSISAARGKTPEQKAIELGFDCNNFKTNFGVEYDMFIKAIIKNDIFRVNRATEEKISVIKKMNDDFVTPIHLAAYIGDTDILEVLIGVINQGNEAPGLDVKTADNFTPLMFASRSGSVKAVELLLNNGADRHITNRHNKTALQLATEARYDDVAELLCNGKNVVQRLWDPRSSNRYTPS